CHWTRVPPAPLTGVYRDPAAARGLGYDDPSVPSMTTQNSCTPATSARTAATVRSAVLRAAARARADRGPAASAATSAIRVRQGLGALPPREHRVDEDRRLRVDVRFQPRQDDEVGRGDEDADRRPPR